MERISAASNLIIEVQPESWRLLVNGGATERVLVEAVPGEPLRYGANFGSRRHLPDNGILPREDIQQIVLGWSEKDDAWHLGLVLKGDLVSTRGSRWCGLAHWHDPLANQFLTVATQAGQTLANQVDIPFVVIQPRSSENPLPDAPAIPEDTTRIPVTTVEPTPEPIPQPAMPLFFDLWTLKQISMVQLELVLSSSWGRSKLVRVAWNIVWLAVFILLTVTTLTSGIALPRPEILVYFGFASILILIVVIFYNLYETATAVNRIVFEQEGVRWMRGNKVRQAIPQDQIQEVYVSHVIAKVGKRGKASEQRAIQFGEVTLLLKDEQFRAVFVQHQTDDTIPVSDDSSNEEYILPLTEYNARTHVQAAALAIAHTLGVPAAYDKRLR